MIFLCGLFIPLGELPLFIRPLSFILPLTYGVDILKNSINGSGVIQPWLSFLVLLGFGLFLFAFSTKNIKRKWIY
jgi:ABC-2 type transport system permease protein